VDVELDGGRFACGYCGADNRLAARDESGDRIRAAAAPEMSEMERYARLREQAAAGWALPESLQPLVDSNSALPRSRVDEVKQSWVEARKRLDAAPSFPRSERLFFLTVLLSPRLGARARRAVLETAIERLPDEGHRHIVRCMLARQAAGEGDVRAAEEWLAACHPRPADLAMDTAYRLAAATLAARLGRDEEVLSLLAEDVPLFELHAVDCALLRIHFLDRVGRREEAIAAYNALWEQIGSDALSRALRASVPPGLGADVHHEAQRRENEERVAELEREVLDPVPGAVREDDPVPGHVAAPVMLAFAPLCCWLFLFLGGGETGGNGENWHEGPLSGSPWWIWLLSFSLAVFFVPGWLLGMAKLAKVQRRARVREKLAKARLELEQRTRGGRGS
jgi:hypothetical protein